MGVRDSLRAGAVTLGELLANGRRYRVPAFQRSYAWTEREWADLWADLLATETTGRDHYLGALVLRSTGPTDEHEVIDGQQRLATLVVLALASVALLERWAGEGREPEANAQRAELLRERLISPRDPASLKRSSRLRLNRSDDGFFQSALVNGQAPANPRRLSRSEQALWAAWGYFQARVHQRFGQASGADVATFVDVTLSRRIVFIEIVVDDEQAAYTVFETLDSRGVALGTADLLKNALFARAAEGGTSDLEEMERLWGRLVSTVALDQVADLVHHHANTRRPNVSKRLLFSTVRDELPTKASAFGYLGDLLSAAEWYAALLDPNDETWADHGVARDWMRVLHLLRAEQYRPLALAALPKFSGDASGLASLFRIIGVVSLRHVVLQTNTGDVHRAWNAAALEVQRGALVTPAQIARAVASIQGDDDAFERAFEVLRLPARGPRKKLLRYLLAQLEADASRRPVDWETDRFTIEHILPESPSEGWAHVDERDRERFVDRIGNYLPLEAALNRGLGQADFAEKKEAYRSSAYELPRRVDGETWGPEAIRARSRALAKRARHIWRLDV